VLDAAAAAVEVAAVGAGVQLRLGAHAAQVVALARRALLGAVVAHVPLAVGAPARVVRVGLLVAVVAVGAAYPFASLGLKVNGVDVSAGVFPNTVTIDNSGPYTFGFPFVFIPWLDIGTGPDIAFCQATLTSSQPWSTGTSLFRDLSFLGGVTSSRVVCQSMDPFNLVATLGSLAMIP
jgi:hypothetical protein